MAERIYTVNLTNAATTFAGGPYSVGADGEVIAYNPADNFIYHWSGNGTANMEKIDAVTFIATPIVQSGASHFEIFGAVYKGGGEFWATDINSRSLTISSTGVVVVVASNLPDDIRGLGYNDPLLPVELSSFTSEVIKRDVVLKWSTASETNNSGFEIQRKSANGEWVRIGWVSGNGTTQIPFNYSFSDRGLNSGSYSYRLKQFDYNGGFEYHNLNNEVLVGTPLKYELSQNYPNPFNPSTKINYDLPFDSKVSIQLFDISGKEVSVLENEFRTAGYYTVDFNAGALPSGAYFYRITAENKGSKFRETKRMMLIK